MIFLLRLTTSRSSSTLKSFDSFSKESPTFCHYFASGVDDIFTMMMMMMMMMMITMIMMMMMVRMVTMTPMFGGWTSSQVATSSRLPTSHSPRKLTSPQEEVMMVVISMMFD